VDDGTAAVGEEGDLVDAGTAAAVDAPAVLVIDDEAPMLDLLRALLEADGFAVYEAMTGPIGLGLIPAVAPRAVVLDVMMPGMDGIEVCTRISADHPDLPVVILTGRDDGDLERRCRAAGAAHFLRKPLLPGELTDVLRPLLAADNGDVAHPITAWLQAPNPAG
jgi:CheY-like chemotaxis protein